jgi:glycerophosphoryl diester phosphodiesterase
VIGHRGAPKQAPENSLASFALAAKLGVTWVELDVQLSRDKVPFVFHDEGLERTSTGSGRLVDRDASYLAGLDIGSWFAPEFISEKLPSFESVIDLLVHLRLGVNIEIKADDALGEVTAEFGLKVAQAKWPSDRSPPLVTSFSRVAVRAAQRFAPDWPRGLVSDLWPEDWREFCAKTDCATLHVPAYQVTQARVQEVNEAGIQVLAYVVDESELAHQLWDWGVSSVFSDRPDQLIG